MKEVLTTRQGVFFCLLFLFLTPLPGRATTRHTGTVRIALVQMEAGHDKQKNLEKIKTFSMNAAGQKARIICFPELSITGYESDNPEPLSEPVPGPSSNAVSHMARANSIVILAGLVEKDQEKLYITQLAAFPDGRLETYRKTHPGRRERNHFTPGNTLPVFHMKNPEGPDLCFAIGICYDMHFPEISAIYSLKGAHIIFSPHASPLGGQKRIEVWNRYFGARAYDNTVYTAACNHITRENGKTLGSGMAVWDPVTAGIIKQSDTREETMLICDLDLSTLNKKRLKTSKTFFLKDRRKELYHSNPPMKNGSPGK